MYVIPVIVCIFELQFKLLNVMRQLIIGLCMLLVGLGSISAQNDFATLLHQGIGLHDKGEYPAAVKVYERALKLKPESMQLYYEMAFSYMSMKKYQRAVDCCEKALASKDSLQNVALVYALMGSAYDNWGKPEEAILTYDKGIKKFPDDYLLYFNRGVAYKKMKDNNEAIKSFISALSLNPRHLSANVELGGLLAANGNIGLAFYNYCFVLLFEPNTPRSKNILGEIMKMDGSPTIQADAKASSGDNYLLRGTEQLNQIVSGVITPSPYLKLYKVLSALYEKQGKLDLAGLPEIYKSFYIPFFTALVGEGHLETFCRKASVSLDNSSVVWISKNEGKVETLHAWVNYYWNANFEEGE